MTAQIPAQPGTSQPAGGPDAAGGTPYPDIAGTWHAAAAAAAFFCSFVTAKTSKDIEATHAHFHPGKTVYCDAALGWALPSNADVRNMREQYMPRWPAGAKSYPTPILGDMTSAVVVTTDTPELSGGEIRTISIADMEDGKIVRLVDYRDGRGFGAELAASLRVPADSYPHDLGVSAVTSRPGPVAAAARELSAAFAGGEAGRAGQLFSYDAVFEDMALRAQLRGQAAIVRYLRRALPSLPCARASARHVAGAGQGGGYQWRADGQPVAAGAAALELSPDGTITTFTLVWDGSLLDDRAITALAADAADNRPSALNRTAPGQVALAAGAVHRARSSTNQTDRKEAIMTTTVSLSFAALTIDSADPPALADFWGKALGRPVSPGAVAGDTAVDATGPDSGPRMILHNPPEPKTANNRIHPVLVTDHHDEETERLTALGARPLNVINVPPAALPPGVAAVRQTTFADPEGNEFDLVTWQPE